MRILFATLVAFALSAGAAQAQTMSFATNPQGSVAYASGAAITKLYGEATGKQARVVPQGGPEAILPLIVAGNFDFAFANVVALNFAFRGLDTFPEPLRDLRAVATVFPLHIGMFVRADSGIETVADLKGKRVASGFPQQRNLQAFTLAFLQAAGLREDDYRPVLAPNGTRAIDDFIAGNVDASVWSMTSGRMAEADVSVGGIRWLPFPKTAMTKEAIAANAPGGQVNVMKPRKAVAGLDQPTPILDLPFVVVTSQDASDQMVYDLVKTIHQQADELQAAVPSFRDMSIERMGLDVGVPYHPAALRYFKEAGIPGPKR